MGVLICENRFVSDNVFWGRGSALTKTGEWHRMASKLDPGGDTSQVL